MISPPRIHRISADGQPREVASQIASVVLGGGIALASLRSEPAELAESIAGHLGELFEPIALPPGIPRSAITEITSKGHVRNATNWHFDQSFDARPPDWSMLCAIEVSEFTAPTVFSDCAVLFSLLSPGLQAVMRTLKAEHAAYYPSAGQERSESRIRSVHPCVIDVEGQMPGVFVAPATVDRFLYWTKRESSALLEMLYTMMSWPELSVVHNWMPGDLVVWPNKRFSHRALAVDSNGPRRLLRVMGHWPCDES